MAAASVLRKRWREALAIAAVIALFIAASHFSREYNDILFDVFGEQTIASVFLYIAIILVSFVLAPLSSLPFLPVATALWGPFPTFILSLIGWTIGTVITYFLARTFGRALVERFVSLEKIERYEQKVPQKNKFAGTAVLHMVISGDILGYVMGLFVKMPYGHYALASFLGNIPFGILLVFAATLPLRWQIVVGVFVVAIASLGAWKIGEKIARQ